MLIRGGVIQTMTEKCTLRGDILIQHGRIAAVEAQMDFPEDDTACLLDADGLTILPGLVDAHIHDGPETEQTLLRSSAASGVTGGLLWPDEDGLCKILRADCAEDSRIFVIHLDEYDDDQLQARLLSLNADGCCPACEVNNPAQCRRILTAMKSTGVKAILAHLIGCEDMLDEIAMSGCDVIVGVNHQRSGNPWAMAHKLDAMGINVALTCNYPDAKLRHLPVCAALCAREGMDRERALRCITAAPAALCGLLGAGVIATGVHADLVIYDGDPLLLASSHVMTIIGGKIRH